MTIDCAYSIEGQGPALFLIHGIGARRATFSGLVTALKDQFTCISYDLRGHGEARYRKAALGWKIWWMIWRLCGPGLALSRRILRGIRWAG